MTGYELADEISRLRPDLKVLFTSGYTELASGNGNGRNARPLLSKPYRKQDLGRAIRRILDGAE
jgi:two-component SAPR family response regulator